VATEFHRADRIWLGAFCLLLIIPVSVALYTNRDPWIDEAMLANNFVEMSIGNLADPMPLYEQAAPVGHIILAKVILSLSDVVDRTLALRCLSLAVALIGIMILFRLAYEQDSLAGSVAAVAIALTSPFFIRYATEIKQYIFDFTAAALVVWTAGRVARSPQKDEFFLFFAASLVACVFSFVAITPIVACLSSAALVRMSSGRRLWNSSLAKLSLAGEAAGFALWGGGAILAAAGFYFLLSRHATSITMAAYPVVFHGFHLGPANSPSDNIALLRTFLSFLAGFWTPTGELPKFVFGDIRIGGTVFVLTMITACFVFCATRNPFIAVSFCGVIAATLLLNALNLVTISVPRYLFYISPFLYLVVAFGGVEMYRRVVAYLPPRVQRIAGIVCASLFVASFGVAGVASARHKVEEISPLLARIIEQSPDSPVWVYYGAQPAMRFLAPATIRQVGLFDPTSTTESWMARGGGRVRNDVYRTDPRYPSTIEEALRGEKSAWLIFSHAWVETGFEPYLAAAGRAVGPCRLAVTAANSRLYFCSAAE